MAFKSNPAKKGVTTFLTYRPVIFDWGALLYTPIQPARAQKCAPIKNEPSILIRQVFILNDTT